MQSLVNALLGSAWKSSLAGLAAAAALAGYNYAQTRAEPVWYLVALAFLWLGRVAGDAAKPPTPPPAP